MSLVVAKFGGTSVASIDCIRQVASFIKDELLVKYSKVIAVVSAMGDETDRLYELARSSAANPNPRELDALLSTGENVTAALLAMVLNDLSVPAKSFTARQAGIHTDNRHNRARIKEIDGTALEACLKDKFVPVVSGFQGSSGTEITTLGRGGSDVTAVAIASALHADKCLISTDVEGIFSADPRICPKAYPLAQSSYEETLELASQGCRVIHPRAVYFAMAQSVALHIKSTFSKSPGTQIVDKDKLMEKPIVRAITHSIEEAKITLHSLKYEPAVLERIFCALAEKDISVDMISQTSQQESQTDLSFTVSDTDSALALETIRALAPSLDATGVSCERDVAKVSVVGIGMAFHSGVAAKIFSALALENIAVKMISTSEIRVSLIVAKKYCDVAVRALHKELAIPFAEKLAVAQN